VRYWGFNTVLAILRSGRNIAGELYLPVRNRATHVLLQHVASHRIKILHRKYDRALYEDGSRVRYPLLITDSEVSLPHTFHTLDHYLDTISNKRQLLLLFDGITDVGNIAAIMRSAYNFGVDCLITSHRTSANIQTLMQRSAGYCVDINIIEQVNIARAIAHLKRAHFWIYGADSDGESLPTIKFTSENIALIVGDEHHGLRRQTKALCDFLIAVPHHREIESLNVSVASAVILYEITRPNFLNQK